MVCYSEILPGVKVFSTAVFYLLFSSTLCPLAMETLELQNREHILFFSEEILKFSKPVLFYKTTDLN